MTPTNSDCPFQKRPIFTLFCERDIHIPEKISVHIYIYPLYPVPFIAHREVVRVAGHPRLAATNRGAATKSNTATNGHADSLI